MPATSVSRINTTLTNYAQGFSQDRASALANFIAPVVGTGIAHSQYKKYSDKNSFQVYNTARAIGGPRRRIEMDAEDPFFNCTPQGLEVPIDDHERELAGPNVSNLQENKIRTLVDSCHTSHEKKVFDLVKGVVSAEVGLGVWSSSANDPIKEIDSCIRKIAVETGRMPNRMVIGLGAWEVIKNHDKVLGRRPGAQIASIDEKILAGMLLNPQMEIKLGVMSYDAKKFGTGKDAYEIVGAEVFIFLGSDTPSLYDPSFAKTFSVDRSMIGAVKEYREERSASDIYYVDWSEDVQVVAPTAGARISIS